MSEWIAYGLGIWLLIVAAMWALCARASHLDEYLADLDDELDRLERRRG